MKIVADENIPLLHEFFGDLGEIHPLPGRTLSAAQVRDADVLLVRSVTPVTEQLLADSQVGFVGTATIGCDHVDLGYLHTQDIAFASAPGFNARGVVEYVLASLSILFEREGWQWPTTRIGIVGLGNVGSRLKQVLEGLGCEVLACDPFLKEQGVPGLVSLDEVLGCDVISLHTPLTRTGPHPTFHLLDAERLARISPRQILINTARGPVIQEEALLEKLQREPEWPVVLDVWETEPQVNPELLERVQIGSAHIAGYSLDGKMRGTEMIYQALCHHLQRPVRHRLADFLPATPLAEVRFGASVAPYDALSIAIRACYDPRTDDGLLRRALRLPTEEHGAAFDSLRKHYRIRREFGLTRISFTEKAPEAERLLKAAGFDTGR